MKRGQTEEAILVIPAFFGLLRRIIIVLFFVSPLVCVADNRVDVQQLNYEGNEQRLLFRTTSLSNSDGMTTVRFNVECQNLPFTIDSLKIVVNDAVYSTDTPFRLEGRREEVMNKRLLWVVEAEFPQLFEFTEDDVMRIYSSEGKFQIPLGASSYYKEELTGARDELKLMKAEAKRARALMWVCAGIALLSMVASAFSWQFWKRSSKRRMEWGAVESVATCARLEAEMAEMKERSKEFMRSGFDVYNSLCNDYFEKSDSELTRATLVGDMERIIMRYRTENGLDDLKAMVNLNMNGIIDCVMDEIPTLSESDIRFLVYLYAGFSPKAVCLMTDSKLKNFYNRRTRLREKILRGDAPHREWFAAEMQAVGQGGQSGMSQF